MSSFLSNACIRLDFSGITSLEKYPAITKWFKKLIKRPGFEAGRNVPRPHFHITLNEATEEEMERVAEGGRKWQDEARERDAVV